MADRIVLAPLITLAVAAVVVLVVSPFAMGTWVDPHDNRGARCVVYAGGVAAVAAIVLLARSAG